MRKLAYKIQKAKNAHYILMNFELEAKWINDFKSMLDKDERVIRHLVIKRDEAITEDCPPPPEFHTLRAGMDDYDEEDDADFDDNDDDVAYDEDCDDEGEVEGYDDDDELGDDIIIVNIDEDNKKDDDDDDDGGGRKSRSSNSTALSNSRRRNKTADEVRR